MRVRACLSGLAEPPWPALLALALAAWLVMAWTGHGREAVQLCLAPDATLYGRSSGELRTLLALQPPMTLIGGWLVMLVAMMAPVLAEPLHDLWARSLPRRRLRSLVLFVAGYVLVWMLAGGVLQATALVLAAMFAGAAPGWLSLLTVAIVAIWQSTPWKQACLNRCHGRPRLSAFGLPADRDSLGYGLRTGAWCIGACWALMLAPLLDRSLHLPWMALAAVVIIGERLAPARSPRWHLPSPRLRRAIGWQRRN